MILSYKFGKWHPSLGISILYDMLKTKEGCKYFSYCIQKSLLLNHVVNYIYSPMLFQALETFPEIIDSINCDDFMHAYALGMLILLRRKLYQW